MKKISYQPDDEIDLISLSKIIWNGKIKILLIIIIFFLIGLFYSNLKPNIYTVSLDINPSNSEFLEFSTIEKMIDNQNVLPNIGTKSIQNQIAIDIVYLNRFIKELSDYEEFIFILKNTKSIKERISNLSTKNQNDELFKYSKLFKIKSSNSNKDNYTIYLDWNNLDEARDILQDTLDLTKKNFGKLQLIELKKKLEFVKKITLIEDSSKVDYLIEQSIIARELEIQDNEISNLNLSQDKLNLSFNIKNAGVYYLRGYKAIEKEIELIKNRKYKNFVSLEKEIENLERKNFEWVNYNVNLTKTRLQKNPKLILLVSFLLGLLIAIFYVLIYEKLNSKSMSKKTN